MIPEVDVHSFALAHAEGARVVDVREPFEFVAGHVAGAQLVPMAQVHARLAEFPRDKRVFVICASGNRSYTAAGWLRGHGIDAVSVAGGTGGWAAQRRPLVSGAHPDESVA